MGLRRCGRSRTATTADRSSDRSTTGTAPRINTVQSGINAVKADDKRHPPLPHLHTVRKCPYEHSQKYFRGVYLTKAKDAIASYLVHKNISILEINAYLDEISSFLREKMAPTFDEYGIHLTSFYVNDINVPEEDNAVKQLKKALAKRAEMEIVGYSYQQERSFDTLEGAATNPGSAQSGFMGAGIGLGMGVGVGGAVGQQFGTLTHNINTAETKNCPKCNAVIDKTDRFCNHCGCDTEAASQKGAAIRCSSCGAALTTESKFCTECGKRYNPCPKCSADIPEGTSVCPSCGSAASKTCPSCGKLISADCKFCPECGQALSKQCPNCGKQIENEAKFCPECGTAVT